MAKNTKNKKVEALMADLHSTDLAKVLAALKKVPEAGNATLITPLLRTYLAWNNQEVRGAVEKILGELKTQTAVPELINALEDPAFDDLRALIISSFWHSGIYPSNDMDVLIKNAIRGDYMVAVEVVTVLENTDEFTDPDMVQQAMLDIDDFLDQNPDAEHSPVLDQLKSVLKTQYNL